MTPLLEFRDWLAESQNPENKPQTREYRGRDGRIRVSKGGHVLWRTYTLDFCREMLRRLLDTQRQVQQARRMDSSQPDTECLQIDRERSAFIIFLKSIYIVIA